MDLLKGLKQVKVGAHVFKVLFPYCFKERMDLKAQTDFNKCVIKIQGTDRGGNFISQSALNVSLIHELLHDIDFVYNNQGLHEAEITRLAEGLTQVLQDNFIIYTKK